MISRACGNPEAKSIFLKGRLVDCNKSGLYPLCPL